jgi:hypothetical protein
MEVTTLNNLEKVLLMILSEHKLGLKIHAITKIFREKHGIEINPNEIRNIVFEPEIKSINGNRHGTSLCYRKKVHSVVINPVFQFCGCR